MNERDFIVSAPENRLRGGLPKVGIRPTIDGRRGGIRESLEEPTMRMAEAAARFISDNARHASGQPVECVIADSCIGGVAEAAACAEKFAREGVGLSLTVTPCWCYGSETMDMDPLTQKAVWGFNGTERPGAVYLAAVLAAHNQKGLPAFSIYGRDVQDLGDGKIAPDVAQKLLRFVRAGLAAATMRGKSYLAIGSVSMGISGSIVTPELFDKHLGMRVEYVDSSEFTRRLALDLFDADELERAREWVAQYCKIGRDPNAPDKRHGEDKKREVLDTSIKMALIARDLMVGNPKLAELGYAEEALGHNAIAAGFQGQRQWTDYSPNGDFLETMLNSSFDWNGIRQPYIMATENDCLNAVTMLMGHLMGGRAQLFADVRTYWSADAVRRVAAYELEGRAAGGVIHLINSGAAALDFAGEALDEGGQPCVKPWWDVTEDDAKACLEATKFCYANLGYFRGGGYSTDFTTRGEMPVTMARLNLVDGLGPVMQIAQGHTVSLPERVHDALDSRTDPTWPTTWFAPNLTGSGAFTDVYSVMSAWGANHAAVSFGHVGADLIALCAMLRIPVAMHNVPEGELMRPSMWNLFGTQCAQDADFRACGALGPLYGWK